MAYFTNNNIKLEFLWKYVPKNYINEIFVLNYFRSIWGNLSKMRAFQNSIKE